jgi:hypothetical protein
MLQADDETDGVSTSAVTAEPKIGNQLFSQMSSGMSSVFNVARRATLWGASGGSAAAAEDR